MKKQPMTKTNDLIGQIKIIIESLNGAPFTHAKIRQELKNKNIDFKINSAYLAVGRDLVKRGFIKKINAGNYRASFIQIGIKEKTAAQEKAPATIKHGHHNFSQVFVAVAAGLEKFSVQYIAHEMGKIGIWKKKETLTKLRPVISRLMKKEFITSNKTRPVVYTMTEKFYLHYLYEMIEQTETAPHLENKIMQAYGRHCGPQIAETEKPETAPAVEIKPEQKPPAAQAPEKPNALQLLDDLRDIIDDKTRTIINAHQRNNDLERNINRLEARISRLTDIVDEKNRINAALQKQLDIARKNQRDGIGGGSTFTIEEMAHGQERQNII
jgi:hypothetical protein